MKPISCEKIAEIINGRFEGQTGLSVNGFNRIEQATEGELTFLSDEKFEKFLATTGASCIIVKDSLKAEPADNQCFIRVENPYFKLAELFKAVDAMAEKPRPMIHPSAVIAESAEISGTAFIGANCVIGENCKVADNVIIMPNITLYDNVSIGKSSKINSGVVIYRDCIIGNEVIIHSGAIIGADGFGYLENVDGSYDKIPQLGNVVIGDRVEIGANTTIDRALLGSTIVEDGVKIDNLVQIGHNCSIGENTAIVSQVGIAGSVNIGKRNRLGGQVGFAGHMDTADDVIVMAQSGVSKSITKKGIYFGSPARERLKGFKIEAVIRSLPEMRNDLNTLKKSVDKMLKQIDNG